MSRSLLAMAASPVVSALVLALMLSIRQRLPASLPDHRTLHSGAVPRTGGLALWSGFAAAAALTGLGGWLMVLLAFLVVLFALEDYRGLSPWARLAGQAAASAGLLIAGVDGDLELAGFAALAAGAAVMWGTNLYNFMDGADGLAGSMTVIGFAALALAAFAQGWERGALMAGAICLAAVPFLAVNWHPARIFLGDAGAVPLGFLAAALGLGGVTLEIWPIWFPVLVFLPFVIDATLTLARRSVSGHSPLEPHRDHCYQRLVRLGLGHAWTGFAYALAMVACACLALGLLVSHSPHGFAALGVASAALGVIYAAVGRAWTARGSAP